MENNKQIKLLAIGNSFSDDALHYLYKIFKSAGYKEVTIANMYIAGATLSRHEKNASTDAPLYEYRKNNDDVWVTTPDYRLKDAIENESWDIITFQQDSGDSGFKETYHTVDGLIAYAKTLVTNKNVLFGWHMTWAYQQNDNPHIYFKRYDYSQMKMYEAIKNAVKEVIIGHKDFKYLIPVGTTIQNVRTSFLGDTMTRDGYHLSLDSGRYAAALTYFKAITGFDLDKVTYYPETLSMSAVKVIKSAVDEAIKKPLEITEIQ